jgi:hypothetical protein
MGNWTIKRPSPLGKAFAGSKPSALKRERSKKAEAFPALAQDFRRPMSFAGAVMTIKSRIFMASCSMAAIGLRLG